MCNHDKSSELIHYKKIFIFDFIKLLLLVIVAYIFCYHLSQMLARFFLIGTLVLFYRSHRNYFWFAFFIIIFTNPLGLFSESLRERSVGIPFFSFGPGISFTYTNLFIIVALIKALIINNKPYKYEFNKALISLFIYFIILILLAFTIHKTTFATVLDILKVAFGYSLIYSLPRLLDRKDQLYSFLYLIIPFVVFFFLDGLYFLLNEYEYLNVGVNRNALLSSSGRLSFRYMFFGGQFHFIYPVFIFSLAISEIDKTKNKLFFTFALLSFGIIIFAALRSWFVIFSIVLLTYFILNRKRILIISIGAIIVIPLMVVTEKSISDTVISPSINRISSIAEINEEGSESYETIDYKISHRLPAQILLIKQNPITGWGFTDKMTDVDVGIFGMIAQVGFVGLILFLYLWYTVIISLINTIRKQKKLSTNRNVLIILLSGFVGLLISHFTTNQIFGINTFPIMVSLLLFLTDFYIKDFTQIFRRKILVDIKQPQRNGYNYER